jgi:CheY-like chemotaxis protein
MNIGMPVMDGIEAAEELHSNGNAPCIIMLTGSNARDDVDRARKAGAAGYVTKDRIASELIDAIVEIVGRT